MKLSAAEQESLAALLSRIYHDILPMEEEYNLRVGEGDFRPRIEYFHDAVRAFTSGASAHREAGGRLTVEWLAYDVGCLRYLIAMPLSSFTPHGATLSPQTALLKADGKPLPSGPKPDRVAKERLRELYQRYAVLFAAMLKPFADADYHDRIEDLNQEVAALHAARREAAAKEADREIAGIEKAHLEYAAAQLAIYEESKDMVKKLAAQGMNLVGKFVESSIAETKREMGR